MNKTININIRGIVFYIDEKAFEKLNQYLQRLRSYFKDSEGGDEILADIESRIAEIFTLRLGKVRQVVMLDDVEAMMNTLGNPEEFGEPIHESKSSDNFSSSGTNFNRRSKRVFRDPDDRVLGGVCSGIGHYFSIDPIWLRLAFVGALFFFGTGVMLYIILWVVIPKALSTADKLEMKGEEVNISNIEKNIREELNNVKNRFNAEMNGTYAQHKGKFGYYTNRFSDFFVNLVKGASLALVRIVSGFAVIIGLLLLAALLMGIFGNHSSVTFSSDWREIHFSGQELLNLFFVNSEQVFWAKTAAFLIFVLPVLMLIYHAIKVLFRIKFRSRPLGISFAILWLSGVILAIWVISDMTSEFKYRGLRKEKFHLAVPASGLINIKLDGQYPESYYNDEENDEEEENQIHHSNKKSIRINGWSSNHFPFRKIDEHTLRFYTPSLDVVKSMDDSVHLIIYRKASGTSRKTARALAEKIKYQFKQDSTGFSFAPYFDIDADGKWRAQELKMVLAIPVNCSVYLDHSVSDLIYDIKNVTNTYDQDMIGHKWQMKAEGLTCLDCPAEEHKSKNNTDDEEEDKENKWEEE